MAAASQAGRGSKPMKTLNEAGGNTWAVDWAGEAAQGPIARSKLVTLDLKNARPPAEGGLDFSPLPFVQHISDHLRQSRQGKGLLDEMNPFFQNPPMGDGVGRVAGHEKRLDIGFQDADSIRKVLAIHVRHDHVGQEQMDIAGVSLAQGQGLARLGGLEDLVAGPFQDRFRQAPHLALILDQ
jgi:hypothetical protein